MSETVREFYTWQALLSLGVSAGVVVMVSGGIRKLTGLAHPVIPFIVAFLIVLGGARYSKALNLALSVDGFFQFVILVINTFLLFCTAIGGQESIIEGAKGQPTGSGQTQSQVVKGWFDSWLR